MHPDKPAASHTGLFILAFIVLLAGLIGYGGSLYNHLQTCDEAVATNWSGVLNMYRRRADLLPNVIASVQTYAAHERELLTELADARGLKLSQGNVDTGASQQQQRTATPHQPSAPARPRAGTAAAADTDSTDNRLA